MKNRAFVQMKNGRFIKATIDGVHVSTRLEEKKIKDLFRYKQILSDKRTESFGNYYRDIEFKL